MPGINVNGGSRALECGWPYNPSTRLALCTPEGILKNRPKTVKYFFPDDRKTPVFG